MALDVGAEAPGFTLRDQNNQQVALSDFRNTKNVLLVFFPLAFTGTCQGELGQIRDNLPAFQNSSAEVLAISVSAPPVHKIWSAGQGYLFSVLSDFWPHGEVSRAYGVLNESNGMPNRGTFVIDVDGIIRFAEVGPPGVPRDQSAWEKALDALPSSSSA
ncbi:peroxiredoxin [Hoyosella subflava]|uniref:Alkyl hydroperoxide reductase E n=1 Tax=Hoyosella subflava (strain DSM 45089 / JCM 17490 / NBRC 109087 / DQS3-9A1) TaxID=443218 RepID=F6EEI5_HOYSD|nr:peroxiredoxin [Hoyosella subflava]AEF39682.1 Alkyl hydroperoxide reductase/ Thiol specific antioxidant/ Mal allergen [Hoyosella subflava DQS3-9A1]